MQRAYSKRRNALIAADDARSEDGPFLCVNPGCRRPVTLHRTFPSRHFQHWRGKGNPECELYGGRPGQGPVPVNVIHRSTAHGEPAKDYASLLFGGDTTSDFSLDIRLPDIAPGTSWPGTIVVREYGSRPITFDRLRRGVLGVRPMERYRFEYRGVVDPDYVEYLESIDLGLNQRVNVFPYAVTRGSKVSQAQPLRAANNYWLLTQDPLETPPNIAPLTEPAVVWHGWRVMRLKLPQFATLQGQLLRDIESWLGHPIVSESARSQIARPVPHHFSEVGLPVFARETEAVFVQVIAADEYRLERDGLLDGSVDQLAGQGVLRCGLGDCGRWTLFADGGAILRWEVEECPFLEPPAVTLAATGGAIPLFSEGAIPWLEDRIRNGQDVSLQLPHESLTEVVSINDERCVSDATNQIIRIDLGALSSIQGASFGNLQITRASATVQDTATRIPDELVSRVKWLKTMVAPNRTSGWLGMAGRPNDAAPTYIRDLQRVRWPNFLAPQLRYVERELRRLGVWDVS